MILGNKRDQEAWLREQSIESLKTNRFLQENDLVLVADTLCFYKIVVGVTDIFLENGLYAQPYQIPLASKDDFGRVKIGNGLEISNGIVSHPEKHLPSDIAIDSNNKFVSDEQISKWDNKVDQTSFDSAINDIVDKAIKGTTWKPPVASFEDLATTYPEPKDTWTAITMDTNKIYMYNAETKTWEDYGQLVTPKMTFDNPNPAINEVGGIGRGTTFKDVPILDILHDMFYKKIDRNNVPKFYYGLVDNPTDFDTSKYTLQEYVKFPYKIQFNNIQDKYVSIFFKPEMESGENIAPTDMFIQRISEELKTAFGLESPNIDLNMLFEFKTLDIKGSNHVVISSKKILSGSYEFLIGRDPHRTVMMTSALLGRVNELENELYKLKSKQTEGGIK